MASAQTLWWIGIGSAAAATVTGAVLVYRGRKGPTAPPQIPEGTTGDRSTRPQRAGPTRSAAAGLHEELCREWNIGNYRPNWRPELNAIVRRAVDRQIEQRKPDWTTLAQFRGEVFYVTRSALRDVCPEIPIPDSIYDIESMGLEHSFYWRELWARFHTYAWETMRGTGALEINPVDTNPASSMCDPDAAYRTERYNWEIILGKREGSMTFAPGSSHVSDCPDQWPAIEARVAREMGVEPETLGAIARGDLPVPS